MQPLVVFSHGKESGPWGSKIKYLAKIAADRSCRVISVDYTGIPSADERVQRLLHTDLGEYTKLVLAGSSMGSYVATLASKSLRPDGLFLLAPAFGLPGYLVQRPAPHAGRTSVIFGREDEVIPLGNILDFAREHDTELHIVHDTHRLMNVLPTVGYLFDRFLEGILRPLE